ncbi:hypothetical protein HPB50_007030 [Hyalomma asiaticum]|uniref:Uncharacterized protein n=1 Tax=Hyalomma asiaticum TaxID=266040 RepID=A0ACB7RIP8_HYAAI|nr:hypothetical protein HPB50_007030 [Hyalomma asiaticum]
MIGASPEARTSDSRTMFLLSDVKSRSSAFSSARAIVFVVCIVLPFSTQCSRAENVTSSLGVESTSFLSRVPTPASSAAGETGLLQTLRRFMASHVISIPNSLTRMLFEANLRPECRWALLKTASAFKHLEPWALRLFDATAKYPTGFLQLSRAEIGAFDECLETEVRDAHGNAVSHGQYCSLLVNLKRDTIGERESQFLASLLHPKLFEFAEQFRETDVPLLRMGLCFLDDCRQSDIQTLVDAVLPYPVDIKVANCVTATPEPWTAREIGIVSFLSVLVIVIAGATAVDLHMDFKQKDSHRSGVLLRLVKVFSARSNTCALFHVANETNPEQYSLRFLHGVRAFSAAHIVLGHCYLVFSDTWGIVNRFLSSSFFAPLSRLSFGVYLIHYPFLNLLLSASRERILSSHFTVVTLFFGVFIWSCLLAYMAFLACEGPTAALDKIVVQRLTGRRKAVTQDHRP